MDQVWFGTRGTSISNTATRFNSVIGGLGWAASEPQSTMVCPSAGTIKTLKVELETAPGSGKSWAFTLMVDGVASTLTVTIADSAVSGSDLVNQVSISAGQFMTLRSIPSGTPADTGPKFTMVFTGTTAKESVIMAAGGPTLNSAANEFAPISIFSGFDHSTTELDRQQMCAGSGTIKNLYVKLSADPGTDPDAYRFTVRLNGVSQTLTTTITANDTTGNDTVNSFTVSPGDLLSVLVEPLNTPSASPRCSISVTFVADTNGESLLLAGSDDDIHFSATEHFGIIGFPDDNWGVGEVTRRTILDTCVLRDLYVELENSPGAGNSYVFSTRILLDSSTDPNATYSDGNMSVTISGTDKTGNDTVNSDSLVPGESIVIQSLPDSLPTIGQAKWGMVMFIGPAFKARGNMLIRAMVAGGFA